MYNLVSIFSILDRNGEKKKVQLSLLYRTSSLFVEIYNVHKNNST